MQQDGCGGFSKQSMPLSDFQLYGDYISDSNIDGMVFFWFVYVYNFRKSGASLGDNFNKEPKWNP